MLAANRTIKSERSRALNEVDDDTVPLIEDHPARELKTRLRSASELHGIEFPARVGAISRALTIDTFRGAGDSAVSNDFQGQPQWLRTASCQNEKQGGIRDVEERSTTKTHLKRCVGHERAYALSTQDLPR